MLSKLRAHLTFANVASALALFGVLAGGTAVAVPGGLVTKDDIAPNAVGRSEIKTGGVQKAEVGRNAVGDSEIRENSVDTGEVENGSLLAQDFAPGQLPAGLPGQAGPKGEKGDKGDAASSGGGGGGSGATDTTLLLGSFLFGGGAATAYCVPSGRPQCSSDVDSGGGGVLPIGATVVARDLTITSQVAPGSGESWTLTLLADGSDTPVSCQISGTATTCNSGTATTTIGAGSRVSLKVVGTSGTAGAYLSFGWRAVTQ